MSTIPKGFKDNYSKHVDKVDSSGKVKKHPRVMSPKQTKKSSLAGMNAQLKREGINLKDLDKEGAQRSQKDKAKVYKKHKMAVMPDDKLDAYNKNLNKK